MEKHLKELKGVIPVLPTPFNDDQSIDVCEYENLLAFARGAGCEFVCLPAFGSEFYKLSADERRCILDAAFANAGDLKIIVQCNHTSPIVVQQLIQDAEGRGAIAINIALPRGFPVSEEQLFCFACSACNSTRLPIIIQDFNPGGSVIGLDFVKRLHKKCKNFRYIKYELSGLGTLINNICNVTNGKVKVLSGWGGELHVRASSRGNCWHYARYPPC